MKVVEGNALEYVKGKRCILIHGCNCFHTMGAGIAAQIREEYPEAYKADLKTKSGDPLKLGTISWARIVQGEFYIFNAYTQFRPGPDAQYVAVRCAMKEVRQHLDESEHSKKFEIVFPMIGCGIGGLVWEYVKEIIEEELHDYNLTLVVYKP